MSKGPKASSTVEAPALVVGYSAHVLTRRRLLAGAGQVAVLAALPLSCAPIASLPWDDGTFWDDGLGWID
jgi:hypothetical protein